MFGKSFDLAPRPRQGFPCFEGLGWAIASGRVDSRGKQLSLQGNPRRVANVDGPDSVTNLRVDQGAGANVVERKGQTAWVGVDCARPHAGVFDRRPWRVGWQRHAFGAGRVD